MLEGKRISELDTVTNLQNGCCFPVLSQGTTKRITFGSLLSEIENNLPETGIEEVKKDVAELKVKSEQIDTLSADVENVKEEVADVDEMVQGQNATIRNYSEKVDTLEQIVEDTHFEDVLELEGQVRANTTNITHKLDNTTSPDNAGKVVGVDEDGSLTFVEGGGGGSALVPDITQAEYDELTPEEQNNGQIRHITDAEETPVPFAVVNDTLTTSANVWTAQKTKSEINTAFSKTAENNIYSDEEVIIGYLILNGVKKPIYRKYYHFDSLINNSVIDNSLNENNCKIFSVIGRCKIGEDQFDFPFANPNGEARIRSNENSLYLYASGGFQYTDVNFSLEYTKTTDIGE